MRTAVMALILIGCTSSAPTSAPTSAALHAGPSLEAIGVPPPTIMDQVPRTRVGFRFDDGRITELDREAVAFVPRWRDGAALIDPERRLYQVWPDGNRRMLVLGATAIATDGERLAYAVVPELLGDLRVHDGERERTIARGFASIGVLRVDGERVLFVGARPSGVAGVWVADPTGARCITNCDLRTGEPWGDRFVAPPTDPALLVAP